MVGRAQMIAFEELMHTPSDNKVTIAYERELSIGCIVNYKYYDTPLDNIINSETLDDISP